MFEFVMDIDYNLDTTAGAVHTITLIFYLALIYI